MTLGIDFIFMPCGFYFTAVYGNLFHGFHVVNVVSSHGWDLVVNFISCIPWESIMTLGN